MLVKDLWLFTLSWSIGQSVNELDVQPYLVKATTKDLKIIYRRSERNRAKMKDMIHKIDPFITITEAHEILGEGFTMKSRPQLLLPLRGLPATRGQSKWLDQLEESNTKGNPGI